jgi:quinol monooxygenase YgiN
MREATGVVTCALLALGALGSGAVLRGEEEAADALITAVTFIHGLPGKEQELKQHLLSLAPPTRAEAGNRRYDLFQSPDHPNEFLRLEEWRSLADLETHKQTPPLRASFERRQHEGWSTEIQVWKRVPEDRQTTGRQDPLKLYPGNYQVLVENDRVRVMDFRLRQGDTEEFHDHPAHVLYVIQGFKVRFSLPDGTTRIRETKAGDVLFSEAVTHSPVNIGDTDAHGILVELKHGR